MFCCQRKISICGIQTFCWRGVFQPKSTLPVEVHGRLLAVLSPVASGPTVVTREVPTLFVTGAIATAQQPLGLIDASRARHEVLHRGDSERGLPTQHGVCGQAATVRGVDYREGGAPTILLGAHIATAAHGAEGQEGERKHGRP